MCIVQAGKHQPVHVSNTNIFVCTKPRKDPGAVPEQLTIYANTVRFKSEPVAMILPMPATSEHGCHMVDVKSIRVFAPLEDHFKPPVAKGRKSKGKAKGSAQSPRKKLVVRRCGAYRYSVVPTLEDFHRLEDHVFKIQDSIFALLQQHYCTDFSFLVCIIDNSGAKQPVAYVHPLADGKLFIPTRHEHGEAAQPPLKRRKKEKADWDHTIYILGTTPPANNGVLRRAEILSARRGFGVLPGGWGKLRDYVPTDVDRRQFHKIVMNGDHPNDDIRVKIREGPFGRVVRWGGGLMKTLRL
ncbi:hypothetical protein HDU85_005936 [Gaertneriomyces sp. JEL0708]|nr:hypothetical protein HDU85_005936 [Gaertneriomyces sp. JEL0708]